MKKKTNKIYSLLFIILLAAFVVNCQGKPAPIVKTNVTQQDTIDNIDTIVEFMDEDILRTEHGREEINPFLTLQFKLSFRRIIVFNCQIKNNSDRPISFRLDTVELTYGSITDHAHTENYIISYHAIYKEDDNITDSDFKEKEATAKQYVMDPKYIIKPGSIIEGYLVFMDTYPQHGDAELFIPIFETDNTLIGVFSFPYVFSIY